MKIHNNYNPVARSVKFALAASLCISASVAVAQEQQTADATKEKAVEKIAVVGSRSAPRSIGDSPVPIDIIGGEELSKNGSTDMLNLITTTVPSLNVHSNPISDAATLVRPMNLRGLSADSTLILTNGKRRHKSSVIAFLGGGINDGAQGADVSVIPGIALKQVEILRDGAAAQYGSDAIAGVINFVLKNADQGGSFEVKHGEYYEGDGTSTEFAGNIGMPLTDNGFVNASFQYKNVDPTSRSEQRPDAQAFADGGNPSIAPIAQVWGSPEISDDLTIFINSGLDLGNGREAYLFGNYSERDVTGGFYYRNPYNRGGVFSNDGGETLLIGNTDLAAGACPTIGLKDGSGSNLPFDAVNSAVGALPSNCFTFFSMFPGGFTPTFGGNVTDTSITAGTKGEFKSGWLEDIMYDFSGSVGRNESSYMMTNTINASLGLDSPTEFNPGKYIQLEKNFTADFVKFVPAGLYEDLTVAFGAQWTEETFEVVAGDSASFEVGQFVDQGFSIGSNGFPGFKPEDAGVSSRRNYAFYTDIEAEMTEALLMGFALRFEDYDTFGSTLNYKLTAQYRLTDDWAVRGSHSTGFRAPTVGQANVSNVQTNLESGLLVDSALLPPTNPVSIELGGSELQPEESTSFAAGVVYSGGDIFMTLDYYRIDVDDRISQSSKINLTDANREALKAAGVKNVDSIQQVSFFTNDFDTKTQGIDFVASYSTYLLEGRSSFNFAYNWNDTSVKSATAITGLDKVSRLENDLPNHRATLTWNQSYDDWSVFVRTNYFGEYQGVHVDWVGTPSEPGTEVNAKAKVTFDAEFSYFINDEFVVSLGAQNIFDTKPERLNLSAVGEPNNAFGGKYYETSPMGINGGYYYLKGTYKF
ncbi:TonB-dependent receptor [Rheinheimera baltica]|uniref:TonB-dependent receptor plug domain-containing protein n=1 Tax=Rheinheimera baltica TaxID=67576 RepID=UPI00273F04C1|nr:TonB-dependent receptor [Rheinheimera baltica]MDP5143440.1 TonB-dependent receptor [Rheinheimera baltica]